MEYKTWDEFKSHVIGSHEEGRDYIKCPKCDAPVRDMRLHFRMKHANFLMPKGTQMRAIIWKDQKSARSKLISKPQEGYFSSKKNSKDLHYRSKFERTVYELLEQDSDVAAFAVEPIKISYFFNGSVRNYVPDIVVAYIDGRKEVWEVKPGSQTTLPINKSKWKYAEVFCEERGMKFEVITEIVKQKYEKKIRDQIRDAAPFGNFFGGKPEPEEDEVEMD